ncbi:hypothetical protein FUAX_02850 [Fulvitalea axinellae]|uniref:Uncharacterized protein n=1 Tax=Fulvitalea axinellae TaxID=1182444 RepID=A0AAU9CWA2_9BACT|nr:hypothetical protein FUAX_02850 [Fulvitalea axinellae]
MKTDEMQILIGEGLGPIRFGNTRDDVRDCFGEPDEMEHTKDDELGKVESWHYDDMEISLSFFEEDGWELGIISVSAPEYKLKDTKMIGLTMDEAVKTANKLKLGKPVKDEENGLVNVFDSELILWFEEGHLAEIQWGPI